MKFVVQIVSLVEIVRSQAQKCRGAGTFPFGNQAVQLSVPTHWCSAPNSVSFQGFKKWSDQLMRKNPSFSVKHEEPKPPAMQKIGGCCENMLGRFDYVGI